MIKSVDDYLDALEAKYPHIPKAELKRVIEQGFWTFYKLNRLGADIQISNYKGTAYCGRMYTDNYRRAKYNNIKYKNKLRLLYSYAREQYDGTYYFGLNEEEWELYNTQLKSKKQRNIKFTNIALYKLKDECFIDKSKKYFFALDYPIDVGWWFKKDEIIPKSFKYIAYRDDSNQIVII